ncbi:toxin-activating lysine-acyltransferase [Malaciobacter mytili]|uniref:RTX toxin-activating lysine-acyltransferase n=1 Tax=Malaciobacter mytili LMG 24559 TaxID=1032238 RepID=A0AAX2ACL9_9BACT|nr:toxin-activating lysine-acyltransferase [Malaciobacter mytili]AXH15458.1 RTX toxin activating acyltransferase, HlyC family [Malaciobacter mytili LMG 24559]RXK14754.1 toxin-activating lysine-acyltransferase [Malaciobacter mytili LMG 24559]
MENKTFEMRAKLTEVLGEALLVVLNSNAHRLSFFVADLEWLLLPPLMKEQFRLYKDKDNKPVGLILWAYVNDEVDKRLQLGVGKLGLDDWNSGDNLWIIDLIAPLGGGDKMLEELKNSSFKGKKFKYQSVDKDGNRKIITENRE